MKKLSILMLGIIIGAGLAITTSTYADDITSLIGRTVQGEFPVTIEGKELSKKALVIDGTSYVPLRAFGDAIGYESSFDSNMGIAFKTKEATKVDNSKTPDEYKQEAKKEEDDGNAKITQKNSENETLVKSLLQDKVKISIQLNLKKSEILALQNNIEAYKTYNTPMNKQIFYPDSDFFTWYKQFTDALIKAEADRSAFQLQLDNLIITLTP